MQSPNLVDQPLQFLNHFPPQLSLYKLWNVCFIALRKSVNQLGHMPPSLHMPATVNLRNCAEKFNEYTNIKPDHTNLRGEGARGGTTIPKTLRLSTSGAAEKGASRG